MASQVATTSHHHMLTGIFTPIKILKYRKVKLTKDNEILVKGKTLFKGYCQSGKIIRPFDDAGWLKTGDLGHWVTQNSFVVTGRKDNMFISGGENIQPEEIEKHLLYLDAIAQAIVVPVSDDEFGYRPAAVIQSKSKKGISASQLIKYLEGNLPRFKIPKNFYYWPDGWSENRIKPSRRLLAESIAARKAALSAIPL